MSGVMRNPVTIGFAALGAAILAAATFAIVPETKQAVILRLNNPIRLVNQWQNDQVIGRTGAGLIARIPFIDKIVWVDKRVLDADLDNTLVLSTDQLRLNVDAFARFRIVDPLRAVTSTAARRTPRSGWPSSFARCWARRCATNWARCRSRCC